MKKNIKSHSVGVALVLSMFLTGCAEQGTKPNIWFPNLNSSSSDTNSQSEHKTNATESSVTESTIDVESLSISSDVVWGIGKTFDELNEKYGDVTRGNFSAYSFKNGYGIYVWQADGGFGNITDIDENISLTRELGGCTMIDAIRAKDFLVGSLTTLNYEEFAEKCGIEYTHIDEDPEMLYDDCWWAYFKHPSYEGVTFSVYTAERDVIDENAGFVVQLDDA